MKSLAFPDMFSNTKTKVVTDKLATINNLKLILSSGVNTLYGDPGYGNDLQSILFESNGLLLPDIIKDKVYTCVTHYIPQLVLNRDDIAITLTKNAVRITLKAYNYITKDLDVYDIDLENEGENL